MATLDPLSFGDLIPGASGSEGVSIDGLTLDAPAVVIAW